MLKKLQSRFPVRLRHRQGVALIIVLAFVVILTGVIVAFFTRSISSLQVSKSSTSGTKVSLFTQGAADTIIANLQQEIAEPSLSSGTTSSTTTIYLPTSASSMLPVLSVGSTSSTAPNLLVLSAPGYFDGAAGGTIPTNATTISSTTPSLNGRYISAARWNEHYLLPLEANAVDATPASGSFTAPNWVLRTRNGVPPPAGMTTLSSQYLASGTNPVEGRFAYAIYNEGGLLDANVAGYPSTTNTNQLAYKPAASFVDLTQVGLSQTQVDQLVGWRNPASTMMPGSFQSPGFTIASGSNYYNFVMSNASGFLKVSSTTLNNNGATSQTTGQSDRMFGSRQELINFVRNGMSPPLTGANLNALNSLGTFSRDINQPSLAGHVSGAPTVQTLAQGGNDQAGLDASVNPAFLSVRVSGTFARNDGTPAVVGEPLVKQRFALNRLAWLTYKGPSSTRAQTDPDIQALINTYGVPLSLLQQGTAANIQKYFGLTWVPDSNSTLGQWSYNVHNGGSGKGKIMLLGDIANLSTREPDFFELLKASVNAGSKAKAAALMTGSGASALLTNASLVSDYQAQMDQSYDYAIIQLGANIIAQSKVDGFGVRIAFNDGNTIHQPKVFYGVENLPYIYRIRWGMLKIRNEKPLSNVAPNQTYPMLSATTGTAGNSGTGQGEGKWVTNTIGPLTDPGVCMLMLVPEIWNPHDQNSPLPVTALRPSLFRIVADSAEPDLVSTTSSNNYNMVGSGGTDNAPPTARTSTSTIAAGGAEPTGTGGQPAFSRFKGGTGTEINGSYQGYPHALTPATTAIDFTITTSTNFREPTLLARYNVPTGLHMDSSSWNSSSNPFGQDMMAVQTTSGAASFTANQGFKADAVNPLTLPTPSLVNSATQYVGIPVSFYPSFWVAGHFTGESSTYYNIFHSATIVVNGTANITFRLQYQDPTNSTNWITYDVKYANPQTQFLDSIFGVPAPGIVATGGMMQSINDWAGFADPRTSRFGAITSGTSHSQNVAYDAPGSAKLLWSSATCDAYATPQTTTANALEWVDQTNDVLITNRPTADGGYSYLFSGSSPVQPPGWNSAAMMQGMLTQNAKTTPGNGNQYSGSFGTPPATTGTTPSANYYSDPDNVIRRAMGGYVTTAAGTTVGLPMASTENPGPSAIKNQSQSRPWFLHRPFRSVAELGYVFSGTPWKNIDFFTPESGDAGLLDVFCINDAGNSAQLVAGKVNLNTKQVPVLQAILGSAYADEANPGGSTTGPLISQTMAESIANDLAVRTTGTALTNIGDLVGKWTGASTTAPIDGSVSYDGFSKDLSTVFGTTTMTNIQRFREAAIRPLAAIGTTRVWNLLIDIVAQTGRYPQSAGTLDKFLVEGEQHYWVHVAIDRFTGQILDKQIEVVRE